MKTPEELGYHLNEGDFYKYYYKFEGTMTLIINEYQMSYESNLYRGYVIPSCDIYEQEDIDKLQIVFNNLQRDLKELNDEGTSTKK